ncbi:MAG: hypothetical protein M1834_008005 [Cirrosporium novae-zelandiae]|nr:MAG: hypothetical protein M1834_008005 [Cirrosporium novae-zelandiae]
MVLAKSKNSVGLGNSLMNDRFGKGKGSDRRKVGTGIERTGPDGETYVTNDKKEASWVKMRSVTEQAPLDEFLSTAELAGTDFTAEKLNSVKIIHTDQKNPYLLSAMEERSTIRKHNENKNKLTVPRRPPWDEKTTPQELDERERESLLQWRRGLAELQDSQDLLMTPFERNLEVWRQLWRVIERSDLVVQIVDARNPLLFRSGDLEKYVKEVDPGKNNLLLVNKADMMTLKQRETWADYFEKEGINYKFFSAALARELNEARETEDYSSDEVEPQPLPNDEEEVDSEDQLAEEAMKIHIQDKEEQRTNENELKGEGEGVPHSDERSRILTVDELEALFLQHAPEVENPDPAHPRKTQIGLVGYPNVGKSSTINALMGAKKVSVSSTPGKTKHFQTLHLSDSIVLCDCPGLVFPSFATTKAELVCNGILPIDQLREFTGPVALVAQRIPQVFLEAVYGIKIQIRPEEEGGTGVPTAEELLIAYAKARGFSTSGLGQPDASRAARYILKDYVNGKLLFCHSPPSDPAMDEREFNRDLYTFSNLPEKRRAHLAADATSDLANTPSPSIDTTFTLPSGSTKSSRLDKRFFGPGSSSAGHMSMPFNYKYSEQGQAAETKKLLSGRKQKMMIALENNIDPSEVKLGGSKKHFKGNKRKSKVRGRMEDD